MNPAEKIVLFCKYYTVVKTPEIVVPPLTGTPGVPGEPCRPDKPGLPGNPYIKKKKTILLAQF